MPDTLLEQKIFRRLLTRSIALPLLAMVLLASGLIYQINRMLVASDRVEATDQIIKQAEKTLELALDMETGQRGYLVSRNPLFLEPYHRALRLYPAQLSQLRSLLQTDPEQSRLLNTISQTQQTWLKNADAEIVQREKGLAYLEHFDAAEGKRLMDDLRDLFRKLITDEEIRRDELSRTEHRSTTFTLGSVFGLATIFGGLLSFGNRRQLLTLSHAYKKALTLSRSQATALLQSEETLQKRETDFRLLFINNPHPMWVYDVETLAFLEVNEAAVNNYGYTRDEFLKLTLKDIRPQEDIPRLMQDVVERRESLMRRDGWRHLRKNGDLIEVEITSHLLEFQGHQAALVVAQDITTRVRATEALRLANEWRDQVTESAIVGVCALDLEGKFTLVNRRMADIFGYPADEMIGLTFTELVLPQERSGVREQFQKTAEKGVPVYSSETRILRKNREEAHVDFGWSPVRTGDNIVGLVGTVADTTDTKRLENQLLQAQKLESVGRLAGGVAHDFNNLLTAIMGYSELAAVDKTASPRVKQYLDYVQQASEKAANLTGQLLAFARKQVIAPKTVDLNSLILNLDRMMRRLIGEHIEIVILPHEKLNAVKVDPGQFEQILINLVVNARDALHDGGKITIETGNVLLDDEYAAQHEGVIPGEHVMLAVSDNGTGINDAVKLHIFEPFFTTKEKGRGTGLGLATVYGIVRQAGGHIWLYSEPGEGTTFRIYLPRTLETLSTAEIKPILQENLNGSETILLVEDEPAVRALAAQSLLGRGYQVLEASNGEEALRLIMGQEEKIDLLITDVIMPQMSGKELSERLKRLRPDLKVLFASGYTENTIVHHGVLESGITFLSKPFTPSALAHKVREILDA